MSFSNDTFASGSVPPVLSQALWLWSPSVSGFPPVVSGYPTGKGYSPTKTGLTSGDVANFIGVPLVYNYTNPPTPVASGDVLNWIRYAEDKVEQDTSILLCPTWVAAMPALTPQIAASLSIITSDPSGIQVQGVDYDLSENSYDFMFNRAQDEAWMYQYLRYRPLRNVVWTPGGYAASGITAIKTIAYVYPLLNTYFNVPRSWFVEDQDFGLVRTVPNQNVQMLPLFAMQLAFMGFAENVPGALWMQYTAGLTSIDYQSRFSFMKELVLCEAAITTLGAIEGSINLGLESIQTQVDGLMSRLAFPKTGPYGPLIASFEQRAKRLLSRAEATAGLAVSVL